MSFAEPKIELVSDVVPLANFFAIVREQELNVFLATHAHPFLILDNLPGPGARLAPKLVPALATGAAHLSPEAKKKLRKDMMTTQTTRQLKAGYERYALEIKKSGRNIDEAISLGRASNSDLLLDDVTVSRTHASFILRDGAFWVTDLGSANHTRIDDRIIAPNQPARIDDGSTLQLGEVMAMFCLPRRFHSYVREFMDGAGLMPQRWGK